ncbi:tRNA-dihydrouridine(20a/20b) synthase [NAD(P)+]-like [Scaptodrosophila lebanonensis]|uniref:tRNA-dihydrouridine(20a/20b) synthase [NAD(P)+]-like n=1 Tax=Drosophila lebanonensis TaxID=7225 RepID=A0A6J2TNK0_DROLE|nr:tRNA-dihydrouridine(20a/20b) synthase [NAD(P)+]-like [Scaptodrosophila lebanonensis]
MHLSERRPHQDIPILFVEARATNPRFLRVSAPMVRYSKLEFRKLVRRNGVQLAFTPMIIAESFNNSEKARQNEFTTSPEDDQPLIAQFAAKDAQEFVTAAQLIYPYCDGIDLNCGCPQSWAISKGYGCGLLRQPELLREVVQCVRRTLPTKFSISVKMRLLSGSDEETSVRRTIDLAQQLEHCGVTFLTLHGRTQAQKHSKDTLNVNAMAEVQKSLQIPLIVNGNVESWRDACELYEQTQAGGVMAARGLLANPALFNSKYPDEVLTPAECMQQWLDIDSAAGKNLHFQCFHHHLTFMWSSRMKRAQRMQFNSLSTKEEVYAFLAKHYDVTPSSSGCRPDIYSNCTYTHFIPPKHARHIATEAAENIWNAKTDGKFFNEFKAQQLSCEKVDDLELGGLFGDLY